MSLPCLLVGGEREYKVGGVGDKEEDGRGVDDVMDTAAATVGGDGGGLDEEEADELSSTTSSDSGEASGDSSDSNSRETSPEHMEVCVCV